MKLSVVIPVRNEEKGITAVAESLSRELELQKIPYEIVLVNDHSTDATPAVLDALAGKDGHIRTTGTLFPYGFGMAISTGLHMATGDIAVIFMGDGSDDVSDVTMYYRTILAGYDCVFGSRFIKGSRVSGYPGMKLILNRLGNKFIQLLFFLSYNDTSNAFKAYRMEVVRAVEPLISQYFNITVELPLKAIIRGFSFAVVPIHWNGRGSGVSKYRIRELSRKYLFSILYVWLERILLKEEIRKPPK